MRSEQEKLARAQRWLRYSQRLMIAFGLPNLALVVWLQASRAAGYEPLSITKLSIWLLLAVVAALGLWFLDQRTRAKVVTLEQGRKQVAAHIRSRGPTLTQQAPKNVKDVN